MEVIHMKTTLIAATMLVMSAFGSLAQAHGHHGYRHHHHHGYRGCAPRYYCNPPVFYNYGWGPAYYDEPLCYRRNTFVLRFGR